MPSHAKTLHAEVIAYDVENKTMTARLKNPGSGPELVEVSLFDSTLSAAESFPGSKYHGGRINQDMAKNVPVGSEVVLEGCQSEGLPADGELQRVRAKWVQRLTTDPKNFLKGFLAVNKDNVSLMDEKAINLDDAQALEERFSVLDTVRDHALSGFEPMAQGVRFRAMVDRGSHYEVIHASPEISTLLVGQKTADEHPRTEPLSKEAVLYSAQFYKSHVTQNFADDIPEGKLVFEALPFKKALRVKQREAPGPVDSGPAPGANAVEGMVLGYASGSCEDGSPSGFRATRIFATSAPASVLETIPASDGKKVVLAPGLENSLQSLAQARKARQVAKTPDPSPGPSRGNTPTA